MATFLLPPFRMPAGTEELKTTLRALVGADNLVDSGDALEALSKDFYWYSPVLRRQLQDKQADMVVRPGDLGQLRSLVSACWSARVPVVARGAGTGNYGQCVPLQGGIILDLSLMDKLEDITEDGVAVSQPGLRLGALES